MEAVECLANWNARPYVDRVEGMVRQLGDRNPETGDQLLQNNMTLLLNSAGAKLARLLTQVVLERKLDADSGLFVGWVTAADQTSEVKAQALELLSRRRYPGLRELIRQVWSSSDARLRLTSLPLLATQFPGDFLEIVGSSQSTLSLAEQQMVLGLLRTMSEPLAAKRLETYLDLALARQLKPELQLDLLEAVQGRSEPQLRTKLAAYQAALPSSGALSRFLPVLVGGDVSRGRELFRTHPNAQCVRCHEAGGDGYQAGPVLKGIGSKVSREYLLDALIDPSKRIADGFATVSLALKDGESVDGIRTRETATSLTLRLSSGETREIRRSDIEKQTSSSVSAMPPMGEVLSLFELRDLIAFLASWN